MFICVIHPWFLSLLLKKNQLPNKEVTDSTLTSREGVVKRSYSLYPFFIHFLSLFTSFLFQKKKEKKKQKQKQKQKANQVSVTCAPYHYNPNSFFFFFFYCRWDKHYLSQTRTKLLAMMPTINTFMVALTCKAGD